MSAQAEIDRLYQATVLDHSRNPRNFRRIAPADRRAEGNNPLCGDRVTLYLHLDDDRIDDAAFEASGCAICLASASMLTTLVRGRRIADVRGTLRDVDAMFRGETPGGAVGDLTALASVRAYPSRVRCALLPWRTLEAALGSAAATVSTESGL
jgi:nitrogen fixation NifU-like protein